jgi:hypothetical protein
LKYAVKGNIATLALRKILTFSFDSIIAELPSYHYYLY